jgi:hypothetical protein
MLAGMALKWRWRARQNATALAATKPDLILGNNVQVVREKFCRYWEVEPRYIPMRDGCYVTTPQEVIGRIDENTIGVVTTRHDLYRRLRSDGSDPRRRGRAQRQARARRADSRRRGQRRFRCAVYRSRITLRFSLAQRGVHPRLGPQIRSGLSGCRLGAMAEQRVFARGSALSRQLPGWRSAHVYAELVSFGRSAKSRQGTR